MAIRQGVTVKRGILLLTSLLVLVAGCPFFAPFPGDELKDSVLRWNQIAVDTSGLDHTAVSESEDRVFGHQLGPTRSSRAMAIVHIAIADSVAVAEGGFEPYTRMDRSRELIDTSAAVAQAAHDTLVALFPSHAARLDAELAADLDARPDSPWKAAGIALGRRAAAEILAMREADGSDISQDYVFHDAPGAWRRDPLNPDQSPLGEEWYHVAPFAMNSVTQFRCAPPPSLDSAEYAEAYEEVVRLGGDGVVTPTARTAEQTEIGIFWAYDGTPSLCAPPRLYNQLARTIAADRDLDGVAYARLFALVNVSMADAGIAVWDAKYYYNFWRPCTGVREADPNTGPSGLGDGNPDTVAIPDFSPLGAPASNLAGRNFTPPFPAYPSGHAGFGGALFETLRQFFGTDDIAFTFVSDELNGVTRDDQGAVRPLVPKSFSTLSEAEESNGQSRIYLGIHWSFDKTEGIEVGNNVAAHVYSNLFRPR